jgi:integration host factor subunit beta
MATLRNETPGELLSGRNSDPSISELLAVSQERVNGQFQVIGNFCSKFVASFTRRAIDSLTETARRHKDGALDGHPQLWQPQLRNQEFPMLKSELIQKMSAKSSHLYQQDLERIVNVVLAEIVNSLKNGGRVELRGFGTFSAKSRTARMGRNPRTGSSVEVIAKRALYFRPGRELRDRLNAPKK